MTSTQKALRQAEHKLNSANKRLAKIKTDHSQSIQLATRVTATMGGAFAMAWFEGRYPDRREILGVDASIIVGGSLTTAALMGWAGEQGAVVEALGNGVLSVYATTKGLQLGQEARDAA
jgi:hypothetical protein